MNDYIKIKRFSNQLSTIALMKEKLMNCHGPLGKELLAIFEHMESVNDRQFETREGSIIIAVNNDSITIQDCDTDTVVTLWLHTEMINGRPADE